MILTNSPPYLTLNLQHALAPSPPIVAPETPLRVAISHMNYAEIGCVLVREGTQIVGILTEREVTQLVAVRTNLDALSVSGVMHFPVTTLLQDDLQDIELVLKLLHQHSLQYLPVVNKQQQVIGLLTPESLCSQMSSRNHTNTYPNYDKKLSLPVQTSHHKNGNIAGMVYQYVQYSDGSDSFSFIDDNCLAIFEVAPERIKEDPSIFWSMTHAEDRTALQASLEHSAESAHPWSLEWRLITPSGRLKWVQAIARSTQLATGDVIWDGVLIDIGDRKKMAAEHNRFFNLPLDILGIVTAEGIFRQVNLAVMLLGYTIEEFLVYPLIELVHVDDQTVTLTEMERVANGASVAFFENRCRCKDGSYRWLAWRAVPAVEAGQIYITARDVTSRKLAEAALRHSHNELEQQVQERTIELQKAYQELTLLIENSPLAVIEWDSNFRVRSWSSQAEKLFGWKAEAVIGKHPEEWSFIYTDDLEKVQAVMAALVSSPEKQGICSNRNYTQSGSIVHCEWYSSALVDELGNPVSILSMALDVTQQKQAEKLLKQQLAAIEASIDGIAILDRNGQYTYVNQAHATLLGYDSAADLIGKTWREIYSSEEIQRFEREIFPVFAHQGYWRGETTGKTHADHFTPQEVALTRLEDGGLTCICRNITERKRFEAELLRSRAELGMRVQERTEELYNANIYLQTEIVRREKLTRKLANSEEALRQSEARLQAILDNAQTVIYLKDTQGRYLLVNQKFEDLFGFAETEVIGKTDYDVFPQEVAEALWKNDQQVLKGGASLEFEETIQQQSCTYTYLSVKFPLLDSTGTLYAVGGISTDITLRKRAEVEILRALERERELNELKSRFITTASHEFRTPLTTILGSAELLEHSSDQWTKEKRTKHHQRIRSTVQHMARLLDDVLTINQVATGELSFYPTLIDVEALCRKILDNLKPSLSDQHTVHFTCQGEVLPAQLDEQLLLQILENLLSNAVKYSPHGGSIFCNLYYAPNTVTFQVRDQGMGIPEADLPRLFEPFHRAMNVGTIAGNGLGLTIVKRATELQGGVVSIDSAIGKGSIFTVKLPLAP